MTVRHRYISTNTLKADPTRTKMLRDRFVADLRRRYHTLQKWITRLVVTEDSFGLLMHHHGIPTNQAVVNDSRFRFLTSSEQVAGFNLWLQESYGKLLEQEQEAYWHQYVEEGYAKGAGRAFDDTHKAKRILASSKEQLAHYAGTKEEFLRQAFGAAESVEKVKLLAGRVLTDLKGVNQAMASQMSRTLTDGLVQGKNPHLIAKELNKTVDTIGKTRSTIIARTEIVRAHAEGQLDALERLGVEQVGVMVEWSTAGDDRVCDLCQSLDGVVMQIKEAHGTIPRHPQCRCAYVPANVGEPIGTTRKVNYGDGVVEVPQTRSATQIESSIQESIQRETGGAKITRWPGADVKVSKRRLSSPLYPKKKSIAKPAKMQREVPSKTLPVAKPAPPASHEAISILKGMNLPQDRSSASYVLKKHPEWVTKKQKKVLQGYVQDVTKKPNPSTESVAKLNPPKEAMYRGVNFVDQIAIDRGLSSSYVYDDTKPLDIYHVTSKQAARSIEKEGFKASAPNTFQGFESEVQGTYGWATLERAQMEMARSVEGLPVEDARAVLDDMVIIKVRVPKSKMGSLMPDEDWSLAKEEWKDSLEQALSVAVEGDLPASSIQSIYTHVP